MIREHCDESFLEGIDSLELDDELDKPAQNCARDLHRFYSARRQTPYNILQYCESMDVPSLSLAIYRWLQIWES